LLNPGHDCCSLYHIPDRNFITPFSLVFNLLPAALETIFLQMDWKCIARTPYSKVEQATQEASLSTPGQQRQFLFADYGNTSGLNQSRADDPSGMSRPIILNGTSNHTQLFVQVTAIIMLLAPYLGINYDSVYVDPDYPERYHDFQAVIRPDKSVEAS
jgi:hypothetical protein